MLKIFVEYFIVIVLIVYSCFLVNIFKRFLHDLITLLLKNIRFAVRNVDFVVTFNLTIYVYRVKALVVGLCTIH